MKLNIRLIGSKQFNTPTRYLIKLINGVIGLWVNLGLHQLSRSLPRHSFNLLNLMQMSKNGTQFIINLVKLPNGYAFDSVQQPQNKPASKKNSSKDKSKNNPGRTIHRIFRELALDPQQPDDVLNPILEQPEQFRRQQPPELEEDFSVEIKRETGLPQSPASWFDLKNIHDIEMQSLPQFFDGKTYKTPELYRKYRDFIVTLYNKNPAEYLTKIACRRILRGDVNTIMKVHSFLEKEGIINFCVSKDGNYTFNSDIFCRVLNEQPKYGVALDKVGDTDEEKTEESIDITNVTVTSISKSFSKSNRCFCTTCSSICGLVWYVKQQETQKITLCVQCFQKLSQNEAKQYSRTDAVKKFESGNQDSKSVWIIDDNLKLLQFASNPTKTWNNLQNIFKQKKSFEEVMLQFMQFPIANFDHTKQKPKDSALRDDISGHVTKLMARLNKNQGRAQGRMQIRPQDLCSEQFTQSALALTKGLCQKLDTNMQYHLKLESTIQNHLFELSSQVSLSRPKIRDQLPSWDENSVKGLSEQFDENEESSENNHYEFGNEGEEQDHGANKDYELDQLINNFDYN